MKDRSLASRTSLTKRQIVTFVTLLSVFGYVLHFIWEYLQCAPFFLHGGANPSIGSMIVAAAGDVVMMVFVYLTVSAAKGALDWFRFDWNFRILVIVAIPSVLLAVFVEILALKVARWTYTESNPVIPWLGVSLLPIFQMLLINPIAFYLSKKTVSAFRSYKHQTMEAL